LREICIVIRSSKLGFHAGLQAVNQMHTKENEDGLFKQKGAKVAKVEAKSKQAD
jgi:hypothetical protein